MAPVLVRSAWMRRERGDRRRDHSYGDLCGESYNSDNLLTCRSCDRDFCYHCGDSGNAMCLECLDKQRLKWSIRLWR